MTTRDSWRYLWEHDHGVVAQLSSTDGSAGDWLTMGKLGANHVVAQTRGVWESWGPTEEISTTVWHHLPPSTGDTSSHRIRPLQVFQFNFHDLLFFPINIDVDSWVGVVRFMTIFPVVVVWWYPWFTLIIQMMVLEVVKVWSLVYMSKYESDLMWAAWWRVEATSCVVLSRSLCLTTVVLDYRLRHWQS